MYLCVHGERAKDYNVITIFAVGRKVLAVSSANFAAASRPKNRTRTASRLLLPPAIFVP